jgi:hypothetical protein
MIKMSSRNIIELCFIILKYGWNCLILLHECVNIAKPMIAKDILEIRKLLEVKDIRRKAVSREIGSLFCKLHK